MENDVITDPPVADPPVIEAKQDPLSNPEVQVAIERARADAYKDALGTRTQDTVRGDTQQPQRLPDNPLDLLSPSAREAYKSLRITDPDAAEAQFAGLSDQLTRAKMNQEAAPLIRSQASMIVRQFKNDRRGKDMGNFEKIEQIFDAAVARVNLAPLVGMPEAEQNRVLTTEWMAAKGQVLEASPTPVVREPTLVASDSPGSGPRKLVKGDLPDDIAAMKKAYNMTDEQVAVIMDDSIQHIAQAGW